MRLNALSLVPAVLAFVVVVGPARAGGGFTASSWGSTTVASSAFVVVSLLTRRIRLGRQELSAAGALLLFGAWTALSLLWTISVPLTMLEVERWLPAFAALLAALFAARAESAWLLALGVVNCLQQTNARFVQDERSSGSGSLGRGCRTG